MQQMYYCPTCRALVPYGAQFCQHCGSLLYWQQQTQPPPVYQQPVNYQQQAPHYYQRVVSICVECQYQNQHEVDHNGEAVVQCQ